jgi:hypothetical protein
MLMLATPNAIFVFISNYRNTRLGNIFLPAMFTWYS